MDGATLNPRGWTTTIGAWSVDIVGDLSELLGNLTRGSIVRLRAGPPDWDAADYEPIAIGQVRNVRGTSPVWTLEVLDLPSALRSRLTVTLDEVALFSDVPQSTTIDSNYTPADGNLRVVSTTGFGRQVAGTGCVKVTPTTGDPFYLTWTGVGLAPVRFTGVSSSGQFGTTAVPAVVGDTVEEVGYVYGHPCDIARKVLQRNGTLGQLPDTWNLGLLHTVIDQTDADNWRDTVAVVGSGSYSWDVLVEGAVEDGYAWLSALLAGGGFFLTMRQGMLTVRAGQDSQSALLHSGITITDADIEAVEEYDAFDADHEPEYGFASVVTSSDEFSVPVAPATLPAKASFVYDLSDRVFSNESEIRPEVRSRVQESATKIPERLVLRCASLRLAQLTPGDLVTLTTVRTASRRDGAAGWDGRLAVVAQVSPDWVGATCKVGLLVYPETDAEFE